MSLLDFFVNIYTGIATAVITVLMVLLYQRKYSFWRSRGVHGPVPVPLIGSSIDSFLQSLPIVFVKHAQKYGRVYGAYEVINPKLVVSDSKLVKQICIKDFHIFTNRRHMENFHEILSKIISITMDKEWKRLRKIISPTFSTGKIKRMKPLIEECIVNAIEHLEMVAEKKEQLNVKQFWSRFTLEVIARCCFAANINSHNDPDNEFFKNVSAFFLKPGVKQMIAVILFFSLPIRVFKLLKIEMIPKTSIDFMSTVVIDLLKKRRQIDSKQNDFLQLLVEAEKEREDKSEPSLTENEIIANCILFFAAGYETTATLLQWCSYALAVNPEVQAKLYNEIKCNFANEDKIDYDTANKLPYLDAFVSETLRMYPPVVTTERTASADVELEDTGIIIPAKTVVTIPIYAIHHDPEYYPEPEQFKPERFLGENRDSIDPYAYLPFGIGPRNCVAMRFALIETKLTLIHTILNFRIDQSYQTPSKPEFLKGSQFLLSKDIFVNIVKR